MGFATIHRRSLGTKNGTPFVRRIAQPVASKAGAYDAQAGPHARQRIDSAVGFWLRFVFPMSFLLGKRVCFFFFGGGLNLNKQRKGGVLSFFSFFLLGRLIEDKQKGSTPGIHQP